MASSDYQVVVQPLPSAEGGGFVAYAPELPGCMSDGSTQEEALQSLQDAIVAWCEEAQATGRPIPTPQVEQYAYAMTA